MWVLRWNPPALPPPALCVGDLCALSLFEDSQSVSCNDHKNPIWIDTVYFGMLPILDAPSLNLPSIPHPTPCTLLTSVHPRDFQVSFALRCNVNGGEEERCSWCLVLSPSVWDLQTHSEPWSFWSFLLLLFLNYDFVFYLQSKSPLFYPLLTPCSSSFPFSNNPNPPPHPTPSTSPFAYCTVCLRGHPSPSPTVCPPVCCLAACVCLVLALSLSLVSVSLVCVSKVSSSIYNFLLVLLLTHALLRFLLFELLCIPTNILTTR